MFSYSLLMKKSSAILLFILTFLLLANGQNASNSATESSSTPTVISNVDEVTLDMLIHTKKNKSVLDLKPEDINVADSGTAVKLSDLHLVTAKSNTDHAITLFYDQLNSSSATNARNISDKILKIFPEQNFSFSVLNFNRRLRLYQDFTSDRIVLKKAIASATNLPTPGKPMVDDAALPEKDLLSIVRTGADSAGAVVSQKDREEARVMLQSIQDSQQLIPDHNVRPSLTGLLALARSQRGLNSRKAIIYFVQGYDVKSNAADTVRDIAGAANRAGVSLYVVDVNAVNQQVDQQLMSMMVISGLNASVRQGGQAGTPANFGGSNGGGVGAPPSAPASGVGADAAGASQGERFANQGVAGGPMALLALGTGGIYMPAGQNLKKPLQHLLEDMTTYYEATYAPPNAEYDGRFRPINVTSVRKDVIIRTRAGYFAVPPGQDSNIRPFEAPLLKVLSGTDLPSDIKFHATVLRLGELPDGNANTLMVEVPVSELTVLEDHNTNLYTLHPSIVVQIKNKDGNVIDHFSQDFPQRGALEKKDDARTGVITLQRHFSVSPGQYVLEAAVLDQNSNKVSAQRINFDVQPSQDALALSDMAMVRRTAAFDTDADPLEPMRYENGRVVPNISGEVVQGTKNISLFFLIHGDSHETDAGAATLEMEVVRNGQPLGRMPLPFHKLPPNATLPYMASIQAGSLPPGKYEVTATLAQGEKSSASSISFQIPGAEIASASVPNSPSENLAKSNDTELVAYSKFSAPDVGSHQNPRLVITPATGVVSHLSDEQAKSMILNARERALKYSVSLPNFTCVEITDRSTDMTGTGQWKHRDSIAELVRFINNTETRSTLEVNGKRNSLDRENMDPEAAFSRGEFGRLLTAVFSPESKAYFEWKETDALGGNTVQVFSYHITKENSALTLTGENNRQEVAAFHGLVYLDDSTTGVRRITIEAEDLPKNFSIHSTSIAVDYDYVPINNHDYLMPITGTVALTRGKHQADMNELEFTAYKRYGSQTKISYDKDARP